MEKDNDGNFEKVDLFSSNDEKLKILGELLSNKSSRDIIKLLIEKEMYTNEIAKELDLRVNLVIHHLKKLEELGLLQIENKSITKKGHEHKHYRINPYIFLLPSETKENIQKKNILEKIFKRGIKFSILGVFFAFAAVYYQFFSIRNADGTSSEVTSLTIPLIIMLAGFVLHHIVHGLPRKRHHAYQSKVQED